MRIIPIKTGKIHCDKGLTITWRKDVGKMIDVPSISWLIDTDKEKILVDTGMCNTERADNYHYKGAIQEEEQSIDKALKKLGIDVLDISKVILTHLHWDHCQNLHFFKNAKFYVQRKELEFAKNPVPPYHNSYEFNIPELKQTFSDISFEILNGDKKITEGIKVVLTPGHSPGHQVVLVDTKKGKYAIAGDAVLSFENLERNGNQKFTMIGRYVDIIESWKSLEKIASISDFILPGHDDKVFDKKEYP